jgi:prevent-host-death family protein
MKIVLPERAVSAKDFQRHPGRYQRLAQAAPVTITAHGEPSLVLMSIAEYHRLKRRDRQVIAIDELTAAQADELLDALKAASPDPDAAKFDGELGSRKP